MSAAAASTPFRIVHTVCSHDCPDSCGVLVTVNDQGRAIKVAGDPAHPVTQGFLCGKVAKYLDRVYAPERILHPLKRKAGAPKGPLPRGREHEAFERISWDEALDGITAQLKQTAETYGPESILPYSYAGTIGVLGFGSMDRRFFHRLGASQLNRTICSEAGGVAWNLVYGKKLGTPTEDFRLAKLILAWGANIHGNNVHLWPMVEQARRNGARLIVIDPYRTRTAALADWHIAIRPGTDGALALGLIHVILNEGLEDRAYIAAMTHGFEQLAERAREYTPERVAAWTGMTAAEIERLAREYATTRPAALRLNYGVQRSQNGGTAVRAIAMLPALTGAWNHRGGGGQLSTSGAFPWDKKAVERPDLALASPLQRLARVVNMSALGHPRVPVRGTAAFKRLGGMHLLCGIDEPEFAANGNELGFDIISAIFHLASGSEEHRGSVRDALGRLDERHSFLCSHGVAGLPLVDLYIRLLKERIADERGRAPARRQAGRAGRSSPWPSPTILTA